jgi:hypothetical protein
VSCSGCPAARHLDGPPGKGPAVVCGVVANDVARSDQIVEGGGDTGLLTAARDGGILFAFCRGQGLPTLGIREDENPRGHYTYCPTWRAEKDRIAAGADRTFPFVRPEPAIGMEGRGANELLFGDDAANEIIGTFDRMKGDPRAELALRGR